MPAAGSAKDQDVTGDGLGPSTRYLPVGVFASVMGVAGLGTAWQAAGERWGWSSGPGRAVAVLAAGLFLIAALAYGHKVVHSARAVAAEWRHPVVAPFAATVSMAVMALAVAFASWSATLATVLWTVGAGAHGALTLFVVRQWIRDDTIRLGHVHPAWFMPAVGNLLAPIAGASIAPGVVWYFFGVGFVYWLALLPLVLLRLVTGERMPDALWPTLAIMVAPPALAALAWTGLGGHWSDPLVRALLGVVLFQFLILVVNARMLVRLPFTMTAWAYTFPLTTASTALVRASSAGLSEYDIPAGIVLGTASVVVGAVLVRTLIAVARRELFRS